MVLQLVEAFSVRLDVLFVIQAFFHDHVHHGVEQRHICPVLELQHVAGIALQRRAARVKNDQFGTTLGRLLEVGRCNRVVLGRIGADDDDDIGISNRRERRGNGT